MRAILGVVLGAGLLLAGCGSEPVATDPETAPVTTPAPPTTAAPATTPPATPSAPGGVIPDDFPLLSGYPSDAEAEPGARGRSGPSRTMEPIVPDACGESVPLPEHTDRLRAAWANPEDYRERQLVTFADAERAQAYAERVVGLFGSCPEEVTSEEPAESRHTTVADSGLGDWSAAASVLYHQQGYPVPGLTTWYVVRVGSAVLLAITTNEGGAGPDPARDAAEQRQRDAHAIAEVVDAMHTLNGDYPSEPPFGPEGYGRVRLGTSHDELLAIPGVRLLGGDTRCLTFEAPGVSGGLERGVGVVYLGLTADAETPERVQVGSTYDEVRAAYPDAEGDDVFLTVTPPGHDDRYYRFDLDHGRVSWIVLVSLRQHCVS